MRFEKGLRISDENIERLAEESICSPQLMQLICLNLCILEQVDEQDVEQIKAETLRR